MRLALARKLGWSSTIRTVLRTAVIFAQWRCRVHGDSHTATFGPPTLREGRAPTPGRLPAAWFGTAAAESLAPCSNRPLRRSVDERQGHCHPRHRERRALP